LEASHPHPFLFGPWAGVLLSKQQPNSVFSQPQPDIAIYQINEIWMPRIYTSAS
jgi:hypothetical protein